MHLRIQAYEEHQSLYVNWLPIKSNVVFSENVLRYQFLEVYKYLFKNVQPLFYWIKLSEVLHWIWMRMVMQNAVAA